MGTHISFVRSANLDSLNIGNLLQMELGGNARASEFFRSRGMKGKVDYNGALAMQYKENLKNAVQKAADAGQPCMALDPDSVVIVEEPEKQSVETDLSLNTNEDVFSDPVVTEPAKPTEPHFYEPPPPVVQSSTSTTAPVKPIPAGKQSAKLIDDFDFDSIPETMPATQAVTYKSPIVRPAETATHVIPSAFAQPEYPVTRQSSSQFWDEHPPSVRSSPGLGELKEKGKELVTRGLQAGKELYNSFMNR
jgi:hypothetical protein